METLEPRVFRPIQCIRVELRARQLFAMNFQLVLGSRSIEDGDDYMGETTSGVVVTDRLVEPANATVLARRP